MTTHTPGPWDLIRPNRGKYGYDPLGVQDRKDAKNIITIIPPYSGDSERAECLANARLIAAAPELLEVARMVQRFYAGHCALTELIEAADEAIAKAEG